MIHLLALQDFAVSIIVDKDFILQLIPIIAIDKRLCQRLKSLKYDLNMFLRVA